MENLDFEVHAGEVFVILGGSGTGKSTLMRHLIGLQFPMGGHVELDVPVRAEAREGTPPFGIMVQAGALFSSMTLLQNVALPLRTWTDLDPASVEIVASARLRLVGLGRLGIGHGSSSHAGAWGLCRSSMRRSPGSSE